MQAVAAELSGCAGKFRCFCRSSLTFTATYKASATPECSSGGSGWSLSSRVGFPYLSHWRFAAFHGTLIFAG